MADQGPSTEYTVVEGDTPLSICSKCYGGRVSLLHRLLQANPTLQNNPAAVLKLPMTLKIPTPPEPESGSGTTSGASGTSRFVRGKAGGFQGRKLLQQPASMLNGVTDDAAKALFESLRIRSIYDLATSRVFKGALSLMAPADRVSAAANSHGFVPSDLILGNPADLSSIRKLLMAGVEELDFGRGDINASFAAALRLKQALGVETVRDLALWPPFQAAREILESTFDAPASSTDDDAPAALVPATGNFATERVYYHSVVMWPSSGQVTTGHKLEEGAVDPLAVGTRPTAYTKPIDGARLTLEQAWYAQGLTLGHLLHSVTLAPGESTRIAVVDWARRTSASKDESTTQLEDLASVGDRARVISEVSDAVANEFQHGDSTTRTDSASGQFGVSGGLGNLLGFSGGTAGGSSVASSVSTTSGTRHVAAEMLQNVHERTQQHATSARGRRAAIIVETSQSEHEVATTRVLTNYNHMHALTIQYYEVLQVYRTMTRPVRSEPLLFIPLRPVMFDKLVVQTNRTLLQQAADALDAQPSAGDVTWSDRIGAYPDPVTVLAALAPGRSWFADKFPVDPTEDDRPARRREEEAAQPEAPEWVTAPPSDWPRIVEPTGSHGPAAANPRLGGATLIQIDVDCADAGTVLDILLGKHSLVAKFPKLATSASVSLPLGDDSRSLRDGDLISVQYPADAAKRKTVQLTYTILLADGRTVRLRHGVAPPSDPATKVAQKFIVARLTPVMPANENEIFEYLERNALYFSLAIWRHAGVSLTGALGAYTFGGKPILDIIDPRPVAITANLIGFRRIDDAAPKVTASAIDAEPIETELPLPTGGVFAEAVLGRSNAAEKLDLTRFWNWQDSPIQVLPPDIAPVSMGSRAQAIDLSSHGLEAQAAKLPDLSQMPNPTGMQDIVRALTANIFRDMSNAAKTAEAAQKALETTASGASNASAESVAAYKAALEHQREMMRTAVDAAKTLLPMVVPEAGAAQAAGSLLGGGGGASTGASLSKVGAVMNAAEKLDAKVGGSGNLQATMQGITGQSVSRPAAADLLIPEDGDDESEDEPLRNP